MENSNTDKNLVQNKRPIEELESSENSMREDRVKSRNTKLFPDCQIKSTVETIRSLLIVFVITLFIFGFVYNFFASKEKDIPEEIFQKLLSVLGTDAQPRLLPIQQASLKTSSSTAQLYQNSSSTSQKHS